VRLLLDTHALYWWSIADPRLSTRANAALGDPANEVLVSVVTGYELGLLFELGRLAGDAGALPSLFQRAGVGVLPMTLGHGIEAARLQRHHRDPLDRLLIAQAKLEGLIIVIRDRMFSLYGVPVLW
jgi:PIN domain nuclease of toxin-antitoxin system